MAESELKLSEYRREVECPCGVKLDLRTQGLLCPGCRAKFRMERKSRMAAAWERFHRRHEQPVRPGAQRADLEELIGAIERLVDALESGRPAYGRHAKRTPSLVLPTPRSPEPRRAVGIPADRLEWE